MTQLVNVRSIKGKPVTRGLNPKAAAMFQVPLDFTSDLILKFEAAFSSDSSNQYGISGVQSVKIDNSQNSDVLTLIFGNADVIVCPPYSMGIFPLLYNGDVMSVTAVSAFNVQCSMTFLNTKEIAQIWTAKLPVAGTINVTGSTVITQKSPGLFVDNSVALTTGLQAKQLMPANANRKMLSVRNPATVIGQGIAAVENVYLIFGNGAGVTTIGNAGQWELLPGEQLPQFEVIYTGEIWFIATTAGHVVTAKQA